MKFITTVSISKLRLIIVIYFIISVISTIEANKIQSSLNITKDPVLSTSSSPKAGNGKQINELLLINQSLKSEIIQKINTLRTEISTRSEADGKIPKAANLVKMYWDETLTLTALKHANSCPALNNLHSSAQLRQNTDKDSPEFNTQYGEIVFITALDGNNKETLKKEKQTPNFPNMFETIKSEVIKGVNKKNYNMSQLIKSYSSADVSSAKINFLNDFLQLINSRTYKVGCHFASCDYGNNKLYKVHVCLFNIGLKEGSTLFKNKNDYSQSEFEENKFNNLLVPKGGNNMLVYKGYIKFGEEKKYQVVAKSESA